jgi:hypothetical protein
MYVYGHKGGPGVSVRALQRLVSTGAGPFAFYFSPLTHGGQVADGESKNHQERSDEQLARCLPDVCFALAGTEGARSGCSIGGSEGGGLARSITTTAATTSGRASSTS